MSRKDKRKHKGVKEKETKNKHRKKEGREEYSKIKAKKRETDGSTLSSS